MVVRLGCWQDASPFFCMIEQWQKCAVRVKLSKTQPTCLLRAVLPLCCMLQHCSRSDAEHVLHARWLCHLVLPVLLLLLQAYMSALAAGMADDGSQGGVDDVSEDNLLAFACNSFEPAVDSNQTTASTESSLQKAVTELKVCRQSASFMAALRQVC